MRWWDGDRPEGSQGEGWGWGRDCRGGEGAWGNCGNWDAKIGGLGYAPSGFERVLCGLGMERAEAKLLTGRIEKLLKEGTREMWLRRVEVHRAKEEERGITEEAKRDKQAAAEYRREHGAGEENRLVSESEEEEDAVEGEELAGEVTHDDVGRVRGRRCWDCARLHKGGERSCKRCGIRLPRRKKKQWNPKGRVRGEDGGEDGFWRSVALMGTRRADERFMGLGWEQPGYWARVNRAEQREAEADMLGNYG